MPSCARFHETVRSLQKRFHHASHLQRGPIYRLAIEQQEDAQALEIFNAMKQTLLPRVRVEDVRDLRYLLKRRLEQGPKVKHENSLLAIRLVLERLQGSYLVSFSTTCLTAHPGLL